MLQQALSPRPFQSSAHQSLSVACAARSLLNLILKGSPLFFYILSFAHIFITLRAQNREVQFLTFMLVSIR